MLKKALLAAVLLAAVGGPAALYTVPDYLRDLRQRWFPSSETTAAKAAASDPLPGAEAALAAGAAPALQGVPIHQLTEVLRFQGVTTGWVLRQWPRVSTGLAELPLQGYRVPLVTGTKDTDVAGSLTYYFNAQQQVQRIALRGTTGDPRKLINLVTTQYKFTRRLTNDPGLFIYEAAGAGGPPAGTLRIESSPVVKSSDPYRRFLVHLVIERPNT